MRKFARGAIASVKTGRIYSLSRRLEPSMPTMPNHGPFFLSTYRRFEDTLKITGGRYESANCRMEITDHTGTHIDALNHMAVNGTLHGGKRADDLFTHQGSKELGVDEINPIVTRGILIDVAGARKMNMLEAPYVITKHDLERTLGLERMDVREGDAVLIHTGWGRLWGIDNQKLINASPGIGLEGAKWLIRKRVSVVGSDTMHFEAFPREDFSSVHQDLLVKNGIPIIENLWLEKLVRDKVYCFMFLCSPLLIKGGTGSPVNPVAVC